MAPRSGGKGGTRRYRRYRRYMVQEVKEVQEIQVVGVQEVVKLFLLNHVINDKRTVRGYYHVYGRNKVTLK